MLKHIGKFLFWVSLAVMFNIYVYFSMGQQMAVDFFGGYIIEMTLSLDNIFLFLMIFTAFKIPEEYQERVLTFGILGAMVLRLIFIVLGVAIIQRFHFIMYIFGFILVISGLKSFKEEHHKDPHDSKVIRALAKVMPITKRLYGHNFFVKINGHRYATPLFAILLLIEGSDVIFALDSIPAIFSITTNLFIAYTSNIFAVMGLRSMYYILARVNARFKYMKYGVSFILIFTGAKLLLMYFNFTIGTIVSVLIILTLILGSIFVSLLIEVIDEHRLKKRYR